MSGYALVTGFCIMPDCRALMSFNPLTVPSTSVLTGRREPLCRTCVERINAPRIAKGMEPVKIAPDAYEAVAIERLG